MAKRSPNPQRPHMVPRRLFHDVPDAQTEPEVENFANLGIVELQRSAEEAKRKWNFDFATETPLEGDWEWEKVEPGVQNGPHEQIDKENLPPASQNPNAENN